MDALQQALIESILKAPVQHDNEGTNKLTTRFRTALEEVDHPRRRLHPRC